MVAKKHPPTSLKSPKHPRHLLMTFRRTVHLEYQCLLSTCLSLASQRLLRRSHFLVCRYKRCSSRRPSCRRKPVIVQRHLDGPPPQSHLMLSRHSQIIPSPVCLFALAHGHHMLAAMHVHAPHKELSPLHRWLGLTPPRFPTPTVASSFDLLLHCSAFQAVTGAHFANPLMKHFPALAIPWT